MTYSPPSENETLANMINTYTALTPGANDLNKGSVIRSLFTAFAIELKRFYSNQVESAISSQREAGYAMFNFQLLQPKEAYTIATFSVPVAPTVPVTVPSGTLVSKRGTSIQYRTVGDYIWNAGVKSVNIGIVCTQQGKIGNTQSGTITQLGSQISGLSNVTVTNTKAVISGSDLETEQERAERFTDFLASIHRGDINSLQYGAKQAKLLDGYGYVVERVMKATVIEGDGFNTIYIDNGTYNTSSNLRSECQKVIDGYVDTDGSFIIGYKAAGVPSTVQIATIQNQPISVSVTPKPGYTLDMIRTAINFAITDLVSSLNIGDKLPVNSISLAVGNVQGVLNHKVTTPTQDVVPDTEVLIKLSAGNPIISLM